MLSKTPFLILLYMKYVIGCKNVGAYKVTITFKGKYSGKKVVTFKIRR